MEEYKIVYIQEVGTNADDTYLYDIYLSNTSDIVWGEGWEVICPAACGDIRPAENTYQRIVEIESPVQIQCVQNNTCFSMQDCIDNIIALAWWYYGGYKPTTISFATDWEKFKKNFIENNLFKIIKEVENND